jgi:hypothetical protein
MPSHSRVIISKLKCERMIISSNTQYLKKQKSNFLESSQKMFSSKIRSKPRNKKSGLQNIEEAREFPA